MKNEKNKSQEKKNKMRINRKKNAPTTTCCAEQYKTNNYIEDMCEEL